MMIWKLWLLTSFLPLSAFWLDEVRSPPGPHVPTRRYCASTDLSNSSGQLTMDWSWDQNEELWMPVLGTAAGRGRNTSEAVLYSGAGSLWGWQLNPPSSWLVFQGAGPRQSANPELCSLLRSGGQPCFEDMRCLGLFGIILGTFSFSAHLRSGTFGSWSLVSAYRSWPCISPGALWTGESEQSSYWQCVCAKLIRARGGGYPCRNMKCKCVSIHLISYQNLWHWEPKKAFFSKKLIISGILYPKKAFFQNSWLSPVFCNSDRKPTNLAE